MPEVYVSSIIRTSIDRVWAVVRDFGAMPAWHPLIAECRIETGAPADQIGCVRSFTLTDGARIREKLLAQSDVDHSFTYSILEADLPLENYMAVVKLTPITDVDHTFGEWQAALYMRSRTREDLVATVGKSVFQAGFDALNTRFD